MSRSRSLAGALQSGVVINEDSADVDFRIESNGLTDAFVVDGGNNGIGIHATPRSDLHTSWSQMFIGQKGSIISERLSAGGIAGIKLTDNIYMDSDTGSFAMLETNQANFISLEAGAFQYRSAVSASAGAAPTMVTHMNIDASGAMTKPLQPAFLARPTSNQNDIATDTDVTVVLGTEVFDQNADFASNLFTAPVAGRYQLSFCLNLRNVDSAADYYEAQIVTSNRNYNFIQDPNYGQDSVYFSLSGSALCDMDASDTARFKIVQASGTAQTDISTESHFSGYLAC